MNYQYPANYEFRQNTRNSPSNGPIYLLIGINCVGPIVRAFSSGNNSILGFILFIYSTFFLLEYCFLLYNRFPENDNSMQKKLIGVAIWSLFSGIMFGLAYQFGAHFPFLFALTVYGVAFAASSVIFYVYIIYNNRINKQQFGKNCCSAGDDQKIVFSEEDYVDVILEKV